MQSDYEERGEEMNKKLVVVLLVAFLFVGGAISLFADEDTPPGETTDTHELIKPHVPESQTNPCGEGNGPGNPG